MKPPRAFGHALPIKTWGRRYGAPLLTMVFGWLLFGGVYLAMNHVDQGSLYTVCHEWSFTESPDVVIISVGTCVDEQDPLLQRCPMLFQMEAEQHQRLFGTLSDGASLVGQPIRVYGRPCGHSWLEQHYALPPPEVVLPPLLLGVTMFVWFLWYVILRYDEEDRRVDDDDDAKKAGRADASNQSNDDDDGDSSEKDDNMPTVLSA